MKIFDRQHPLFVYLLLHHITIHMTKTSQSFPLNFCKTGVRNGLGMRLAKIDNQLAYHSLLSNRRLQFHIQVKW